MFASANARIFAQAATIFDGKISDCELHRLLSAKAVGSPPHVSSHRASRSALALLFQQAVSCLRVSRRKHLCAEILPPWFLKCERKYPSSEMSDQKSEIRGPAPEISSQRTDVQSLGVRSHILPRGKKRFRLFNHAAEHFFADSISIILTSDL